MELLTILTMVMAADDLWDWTIGPYERLLGDAIWALLMFAIVGGVWLKTRSFAPTLFTMMICGLVLSQWLPGTIGAILVFSVALGVTLIFYRLLVRKY
jgi:hypothetical protein